MKIGFVSLGCPKNQLDTEVMLKQLLDAGYEITAEESEADIVILNTCSFIEDAVNEGIQNILDLAWLKENANLKGLIVTGCMAEMHREEILTQFPEVDAVLGTGSVHEILTAVEKVAKGERGYTSFLPCDQAKLGGERVLTTPSHYAYLKIAEGCDNHCTYCVIPKLRGKYRSRPMEDLVAEAKELEALGVKELILIAQDTTRYGIDLYGEFKLTALIQAICKETAIPWIRLLYCYPDSTTDELIAELANNPRLCKYVDIPIQHIDDDILRRMNRRGDSQTIRTLLRKLRTQVEGITLRSTVICGFPGETQAQFDALLSFLDEEPFDCLGAFPYSQEALSPSSKFPDQIDVQTKQDRADLVMEQASERMFAQNEKKIGSELVVLCEEYDPVSEVYFGRTQGQAPEIDNKIFFRGRKGAYQGGDFVRVRITEVLDYDLIGEEMGSRK